MASSTLIDQARHAIGSLYAGNNPNGVIPEQLGEWGPFYTDLCHAWEADGVTGVRRTFDAAARLDKRLYVLLSSDAPPEPPKAATPSEAPPLPPDARAIERDAAPCGALLDEYVAFASKAAPMTPPSFHEAAGLFATSVAVARRLVLRASTSSIYPNLYLLFIGPSTVYRKTTGLRIVSDLFRRADAEHLLLPHRMTPEAIVQELGASIPTTLATWDEFARILWLRERAYAAQRGWMLDEAGSLLDGLKRDYNSGLLGLLLNLYECPDVTTEQTIGRGRTTVYRAYLSFFGVTTPASASEHLRNRALWTNGFWARFALITPDAPPSWTFFPPEIPFPHSLIQSFDRLYHLFPLPQARLVEVEDYEGKKMKSIEVTHVDPQNAILDEGVWQAWETYSKALSYTLVRGPGVDPALHGSYGRLGTHAIKVAMLLAAMDTPIGQSVHVARRHFARAQQITEGWRAALHQLWQANHATEEAQQSDKMRDLLALAGPGGMPAREVYRTLGLGAAEGRSLFEELIKGGDAEHYRATGSHGRPVEYWRLVVPVAVHANQ